MVLKGFINVKRWQEVDKSRCISPRLHQKKVERAKQTVVDPRNKKHSRDFRTLCERRVKVKNKLYFSGGSSSVSSCLELCTWGQLEIEGWRRRR